jgi:hypothetical protein
MNFGSLHNFLRIKTIKNDLKLPHNAVPQSDPRPRPFGHGGLPHAVDWKAARPRPAARSSRGAAHVLRARQVRCGVVTTRNSRAGRRDGAPVGGTVAASRRQCLGLEHHGWAADVPDKESGGGAHRGGGATTGRRGGSVQRCTAASSLEGGSAATPSSS